MILLSLVRFRSVHVVPGKERPEWAWTPAEPVLVEVSDGFLWLPNGVGVPLADVLDVVRATPPVDVPRDDPPASAPRARGGKTKGGPKV